MLSTLWAIFIFVTVFFKNLPDKFMLLVTLKICYLCLKTISEIETFGTYFSKLVLKALNMQLLFFNNEFSPIPSTCSDLNHACKLS